MEKRRGFIPAMMLGFLFAFALVFASIELPSILNEFLLSFFPDFGHDYASATAFVDELRPIGYIALAITIILAIVGFALRRRSLVIAGSFGFYIPVFGTFAVAMFFLSGIGVIRLLWLPLFDNCAWVLRLGHVIYLPFEIILALAQPITLINLFAYSLVVQMISLLSIALMTLGLVILAFGTATWLYSRFQEEQLVDYWVYRYSRHPQYLGFLVWSYGALILATYAGVPFGGLFLAPSFPWLVSSFSIIAIGMYEETNLVSSLSDYSDYRKETSFLIPVPRKLAELVKKPIPMLIGKEWPETGKDVAAATLFYLTVMVLFSIPLASIYLVFPLW